MMCASDWLVTTPGFTGVEVRPVPGHDDDDVDNALGTKTSHTRWCSLGAISSPGGNKHGIEPPKPDSVVLTVSEWSTSSLLEDLWWQTGASLPMRGSCGMAVHAGRAGRLTCTATDRSVAGDTEDSMKLVSATSERRRLRWRTPAGGVTRTELVGLLAATCTRLVSEHRKAESETLRLSPCDMATTDKWRRSTERRR